MSPLASFIEHPETTLTCAVGDIVFTEDGPSNGCMYALLEGHVTLLRRGRELERVTEPGGVFGEMGMIDNLPRSATARIESPTRLAVISDERFRELVLRNPSFALEMMRLLARRVRANLL